MTDFVAAQSRGIETPRPARRAHRLPASLEAFILLLLIWTIAAPMANADRVREALKRTSTPVTLSALILDGWSLERPVLPAPHQIAAEIWTSVTSNPPNSRRNLLFHVWATLDASLCGLAFGIVLGGALAVLLQEFRLFEVAALPWIVASQTIPTLALAPIVVVLLGRLGVSGLWQKATIDALIVFFPITLALLKGLRAPEPALLDLMRTYGASRWATLIKIRFPAALSFFFPALKVAVALSIVATIVGELPTGAQAGLGARLLVGSYNGLMLVVWSALVAASLTTAVLIALVSVCERAILAPTSRK